MLLLPPSNFMNITLRDAIFAAVSYAGIFDYPLTEEEVRIWLPYIRKFSRRSLKNMYSSYHFDRRQFEKRKKRALWSADKWVSARRVAKFLKIIPTITLVGVTGGLTRSNAGDADDIDFLIITTPKTLWVTRALSTILLDLFRLRRRPRDTKFRNLICLNMFMSEDGLRVPPKERDFFTAHEVLLMTPLWERDGVYKRFLYANAWVRKFLPNAWQKRNQELGESYSLPLIHTSGFLLQLIEPVAQFIQLRYMNRRRTTEVISDNVVRFHPRDARVWIKRELGERLTHFNVPLDKIFYGR